MSVSIGLHLMRSLRGGRVKSNIQIRITERDKSIFQWLYLWKVLPTKVIAIRFFESASPRTAYNRLTTLAKLGYVDLVTTNKSGKEFCWVLGKKGFESLGLDVSKLHDPGFRSEAMEHDLLVASLHIGEWLMGMPDSVKVFTEQQLRRTQYEHYPSWVPRSETHRPDGYWNIPFSGKRRTIAIEVELTRKVAEDYRTVAGFYYRHAKEIFAVIWLVPTISFAKKIQELLLRPSLEHKQNHIFLSLKDFRLKGWHAPFCLEKDSRYSLAKLLTFETQELPPVNLLTCKFFDRRKCAIASAASHSSEVSSFRDRPRSERGLSLLTPIAPHQHSIPLNSPTSHLAEPALSLTNQY